MHPRVDRPLSTLRRASLLLAACALCATAAFADAPQSTSTPDEAKSSSTPATDDRTIVRIVKIEDPATEAAAAPQGMIAVRDAETGELRAPTAGEWSELSASFDPLNRSADGLEEIHYADGTVGVRLQGRFQTMSTVQGADDGSLHAGCTHSAETLGRLLSDEPADASTAPTASVSETTEEVRDVR